MKHITLEWIHKAEEDLHVATLLQRDQEYHGCDAACFHAQQAAEKYIKGLIYEELDEPPRTHDLGKLLHLLIPAHPELIVLLPDCVYLTPFAVSIRYPDDCAGERDVELAIDAVRRVRSALSTKLQLTPID